MDKSLSRRLVWLQLFRAPNLFTVPGDPLAGYLLASRDPELAVLLFAAAASLCFYAAGLLMNDLADREEDGRERPTRPLPGGATTVGAVWSVMVALLFAGLIWCALASRFALAVGFLLVGAVTIYNLWTKKVFMLGAINMGLCRGLNVLLGAAFAGMVTVPVLVAACVTTVYIAAITHLARFETKSSASPFAISLPILAFAVGIITFPASPLHFHSPAFFVFYALAVIAVAGISARLLRNAATPLPPYIGAFIRALLFVQAAFCVAAHQGWWSAGAAALLLALVPISHLAGRRFYAS